MKKNIQTTAFLGAVAQAGQFIDNHSEALTAKGLNPAALKAAVTQCGSTTQVAEQSQANAKTALRNSTQSLNDTVAQRYPEFSSVIDLLRGAVGNNTPLGRQLTNIRKAANKRTARRTEGTELKKAA